MSALWLLGLGANAADLIDREAPVAPEFTSYDDVTAINRTAQTFVVGDAYVLYNKGTERFYYQGNAWGTQATGSLEQAMIARFVIPSGKSLTDKQLYIHNYVPTKSAWMTAFVTTGDGRVGGVYGTGTPALFVDNSDHTGSLMWIEEVGSKTYRISISEANTTAQPEGCFLGIDPNGPGVDGGDDGSVIMPKLAPADGICLDWELYPVPEWTTYFRAKDVFDKAGELKKVIADAEELGIDVSAAAAVYNNLNATLEQLQQAMEALQQEMAGGIASGTPDNPSNATSLINNPNFDNASSAGWSGTAPNMTGSGAHGPANVPEHYNKTFDTYQDIADLPNGVYCLNLYTFHRGSYADFTNGTNQDAYPYLYSVANDSTTVLFNNAWSALNTEPMAGATEWGVNATETTTIGNGVTYYIPNDPSAFRVYYEKGFYETTLFFDVIDGKARIGVKKDKTATSTDWAVFDTFRLHYYGNEPASYQKWAELGAPKVETPAGTIYTQMYMDAYVEAVKNAKASNKAEALAAIENAKQKAAELSKNISLWKQWDKLVLDAYTMYTVDDRYSWLFYTGVLSDYYESDDNGEDGPGYKTIITERSLTNEQLEAEIAFVQGIIEAIEDEYKNQIQEDTDVTNILVNPGFENGTEGWTLEHNGTGNFQLGGNSDNHCFEAWHETVFDVYQVVKNAPVGVYEISVKGFVRYHDGTVAINDKENQPATIPVYVYMNNATSSLANWFDYPKEESFYQAVSGAAYLADNDGYAYPDNMTAASAAFREGGYQRSAYGLIAQAGDEMRIGVRGNTGTAEFWPIWDDFHLIYRGFRADVVEPALDEALKTLDLSQYMGKSVYAKAEELNKRAQEAKASGDGREMFAVLNDVYDLSNEIVASVALFKKLWDAAETTLGEAIYDSPAAASVRNEAAALQGRILGGIESHEYDDADAEALLDEIDKMITKLGIPAGGENATDANPSDFTRVIKNPAYEENVNGWSGTVAAWGGDTSQNAEIYNANYDYYQELKGLYEGTYQVSVQGFYRAGFATGDYSSWIENPELNNNAFLYASVINGTDTTTFSKPLIRLAAEASSEEEVGEPADGYVWAKERTSADSYDGMVVCNNMTTAGYEFENGKYANNILTFKLAEGAKLRIGLKKNVNIEGNWTIFDNWKLTYFGKNSEKTVDGDPSGIENVSDMPMLNVEYFTLDGRKANSLQKGIMIQKTTLGNGAVIVRKVRK